MPEELRRDPQAVSRAMMQAQFDHGTVSGKWKDVWYDHPLPAMNEPHKAVCSLTPLEGVPGDRKADLFLRAGVAHNQLLNIADIDLVSMLVHYMLSIASAPF